MSSNMETPGYNAVTIETVVHTPLLKVWQYWTEPGHITKWCQASEDWHVPEAQNDLRTGGQFKTVMAAKDGSFSFDFGGLYDDVVAHQHIHYTMADGRKAKITFTGQNDKTKVRQTFDAEATNSVEMQRAGWQAILDNFKKYTEAN